MNGYKVTISDSFQIPPQDRDKTKSELLQELDSLRRRVAELTVKEDRYRKASTDHTRLAAVVADSNDAITVQNFDGTILEWNRGAERMYGYTQEEALDGNIFIIIPEDKRKEYRRVIDKLANGQTVKPRETKRVTKDSRILDVWLTETVLKDDNGKPYAIATTERDITEQKRREQKQKNLIKQLETALQNLKDTNNLKNNMLGTVAHDLRNPLFVINAYTDILLDKNNNRNLNQKQIKTLEKIF